MQLIYNLMTIISTFAIIIIIFSVVTYGLYKKVDVYAAFVEGGKEGFQTAIKIIPYLVGMLVAIGIFRSSGAMYVLMYLLTPIVEVFNFSAELIPLIIIRSLSGSGAIGVATELMTVYGPDSQIGFTASLMVGSTETTLYVLALYFGSIGIIKERHSLTSGLVADLAGAVASVAIANLIFSLM